MCKAIQDRRITKPVVAWCVGTCAKIFPYEVQFGHAGALATATEQTADAKNAALRAAGAVVPTNFNDLGSCVQQVYTQLVKDGKIVPGKEIDAPTVWS